MCRSKSPPGGALNHNLEMTDETFDDPDDDIDISDEDADGEAPLPAQELVAIPTEAAAGTPDMNAFSNETDGSLLLEVRSALGRSMDPYCWPQAYDDDVVKMRDGNNYNEEAECSDDDALDSLDYRSRSCFPRSESITRASPTSIASSPN